MSRLVHAISHSWHLEVARNGTSCPKDYVFSDLPIPGAPSLFWCRGILDLATNCNLQLIYQHLSTFCTLRVWPAMWRARDCGCWVDYGCHMVLQALYATKFHGFGILAVSWKEWSGMNGTSYACRNRVRKCIPCYSMFGHWIAARPAYDMRLVLSHNAKTPLRVQVCESCLHPKGPVHHLWAAGWLEAHSIGWGGSLQALLCRVESESRRFQKPESRLDQKQKYSMYL